VVASTLSASAPAPLLLEAVTLLMQRQCEMDAWVTQQVDLARQAADRAEVRQMAIVARVERMEQRLAALHPRPASTNGHYAGVRADLAPVPPVAPPTANGHAAPDPVVAVAQSTTVVPNAPSNWDIIGETPGARFGALLIGGGAVAVLYGLLVQFGGR
jgi:hypothetical protein